MSRRWVWIMCLGSAVTPGCRQTDTVSLAPRAPAVHEDASVSVGVPADDAGGAIAPADDAGVALPQADAASPEAGTACVRALDCVAAHGLVRCERGLVDWACERGRCVASCSGPCTGDCECPSGQCRDGVCVHGPRGDPCPACTFTSTCTVSPTCPFVCLTEARGFPGGQLTESCRTSEDCTEGHCEPAPDGLCLQTCGTDTECRPEYRCVFVSERSTERSCWPR